MTFSEWLKKNNGQIPVSPQRPAESENKTVVQADQKSGFSDWINNGGLERNGLTATGLPSQTKSTPTAQIPTQKPTETTFTAGVLRDVNTVRKDLTQAEEELNSLLAKEPTTLYAALSHQSELGSNVPVWGSDITETASEETATHGKQTLTKEEELKKKVALLKDEIFYSEYVDYLSLQNSDDFTTGSQYARTGEMQTKLSGRTYRSGEDVTYEYINNRNGYRDQYNHDHDVMNSDNVNPFDDGLSSMEKAGYDYLQDDEIKVYNYLYSTKGKDAASAFLDFMSTTLTARMRVATEGAAKAFADAHPFWASAATLMVAPQKSAAYVGQVFDYLADGKIDENAAYNSVIHSSNAIRGKVSEKIESSGKWGSIGSFAYQTGMGLGDFLVSTAAAGGNGTLALAIMGTSAAADTTISAKDRGLSDNQAFSLGAIAGAAEILTEKIGLDALFDTALKGKSKFQYFLKNAFGEAVEEPTSSLINHLADIYIAGDKSQFEQNIKAYMENEGLTESEAFAKATVDLAVSLGLDTLGGLASGSAIGGGSLAIDYVSKKATKKSSLSPNVSTAQQPHSDPQTADSVTPAAVSGDNASPDSTPLSPQQQASAAANNSPQAVYENILALGNNAAADPVAAAVDAFRQTGTVTNKLAQDIINNSEALKQLQQQTGTTITGTNSQRRAAVKEAVAQLAHQTAVDTPPQTDYDNTTNQGGVINGSNAEPRLSRTDEAGLPGGAGAGRLRGADTEASSASGQTSGALEGNAVLGASGMEQGPGGNNFEVQLRVSPVLRISDQLRSAQTQRGTQSYQVRDTTNQPETYSAALFAGRDADKVNGWCVTGKTGPELQEEGVRTFMNDSGTVGVGVAPNGDIVAVFKNPNGGPSRALDTLMPIAIEQGGDRLDCYGEGLVRAYENYGFIPVARVEFNPEYANPGWDSSKGTPWIYFMIHNGDSAATVAQSIGKYGHMSMEQLDTLPTYGKDDYDAAMDYRDSLLDKNSNQTPPSSTGGTQHPANTDPSATQQPKKQKTPSPDDSVGAAPAGFDPSTHLQYEYGTLPEGENPVRSDDLPASTNGTDRVSLTARTVKGAEVTPDDFVDLLNRDTASGGMSYIPITNNATVQRAIDYITKKGWNEALESWQKSVYKGEAGADLSAIGALLLNNAAKAGDKDAWLNILHDYQHLGTNTAQGLQALRILKKLTPSDKLHMARKTIDQMIEDMKLQTAITIDPELEKAYLEAETDAERDNILKKIQKNVADQLPVTFMQKFTALRYLKMLGNLRTQVRNFFGNASMAAVRSLHNAVATGLEALVSKASGGKLQRTRSLTVSKEQMASARADFTDMQEAVMEGGKFNDTSESDVFARGVYEQQQIFKNNILEGYRKVTNWMMEQGDVFFAKEAYARALAGYLKAKGITETDYSKIDTAVLEDARLFAAKEAQEATFRDTSALVDWISKFGRSKNDPALTKAFTEGIMPFRKTPANVLVRATEYSPLGVLNAINSSVQKVAGNTKLAEKNGLLGTYARAGQSISGADVINSWSKALTGTGIFALGMLLNTLGVLAPGAGDDEEKDKFDEMNGWQNYAVTRPDGTNFTIDFLSPTCIPLLMGAELSRMMQDKNISVKEIEAALTSLADPMIEMSMLQGVNDTLENVRYAESNLGQLFINACLSYLTQGWTNTIAGQVERTFEDSRMQTYVDKDSPLPDWLQRTLGKASAKIPGWDYNQIPYINAWGEEEKSLPTALNAVYNLLSPAYIDKGKDDPLTQELNRLNEVQGKNVYPSLPDKTVTVDGTKRNLSAEEYVELAKLRGKTQKQLVQSLIDHPSYASLSDTDKQKAISFAYEYAADYAAGEVIDGHPGITTKWMQNISNNPAEAILRHIATGTTEKYTSLPISDAKSVTDLLGGLRPETGKTNVSTIQQIEAVAGADSFLTEKEQKTVMADILTDSAYAKYKKILALGMDTDDYAASYRIYLDAEGSGKKARTIAQYQQKFGIPYDTAKTLYEIYCPPAKKTS